MSNPTCPKCGAESGDDWSRCEGSCPMPGSPHFKDDLSVRYPEQLAAVCPYCLEEVGYKWLGGFISELSNVLIGSTVLHAECWEAALNNEPVKEAEHDSQSREA